MTFEEIKNLVELQINSDTKNIAFELMKNLTKSDMSTYLTLVTFKHSDCGFNYRNLRWEGYSLKEDDVYFFGWWKNAETGFTEMYLASHQNTTLPIATFDDRLIADLEKMINDMYVFNYDELIKLLNYNKND